jgi:hypothetical protein
MTPTIRSFTIAALAALALPALAQNQGASEKKLYCWDQNGVRVCSDTLPPEALQRQRDEINSNSGTLTRPEERAAAAVEDAQRLADLAAEETRRRTDQAMLLSFQDEDDLRRVFKERIGIVDNSIATARYNVASLRDGLLSLLQGARDRELAQQPTPAKSAADIRVRHDELLRQQRMQASFEKQRKDLDVEIANTLVRYRQLKDSATNGDVAIAPHQ